MSKYPKTLGRIEAVWNKLGGEDGVDRFLSGKLSVSEPTHSLRQEDGVIYFSVTSDGTTGEDETRAWTIKQNSTAPEAGTAIHTDFKEKFIRAEVINWQDLLSAGSYAKAREKGLVRTEGKEYIVQDGDVIEFRI